MSKPIFEENLLFVVLALQNDFLTRDELAEVLNAWALDKSKAIADVMLERNFLRAEDRPVIDLLIRRQLQRHGTPQESILRSPTVNHLLQSIQSVVDEELRGSLRAMLGDDSNPTDITRSFGAARDPLTPTDFDIRAHGGFDRYKVLRPHAKGGLGEVFLARDEELDREVALKEIQPRFAKDQASFLRFVIEARVTGGLEHPGVVPIYGFGQYPDGRPFYAMRFIRGESLKDAVDQFHGPQGTRDSGRRRLAFRKLLRRLIDACNAVGYAHHRGVLHRDLKPANVMLGRFGETMVVDWGLAKVIGRDEIHQGDESTLMPTSGSFVTATLQGSAMGTPAFMSPEQAEGRLDDMGPASDVYSLGATLYVILTGKPAFEGDSLHDVLTLVRENRFRRPREVDGDVPPALDAICRKAMTRDPADRYTSTLAFAADVEHWLADEPVSAYPERLLARMGRWFRRHRTAATALAVVLAMVQLQRLSGCRPGEIILLRPCDIDRSGSVWEYIPQTHKTEHHGKRRTIYFGPRAQMVLAPWLDCRSDSYCFSPAEARARYDARRRAARLTPMTPSHQERAKLQGSNRKPGDHYDVAAYGHPSLLEAPRSRHSALGRALRR